MQKYGFDDARPVLERASARETAARVALGAVAAAFLQQAVGVRLVVATSSPSARSARRTASCPEPDDVAPARRRPGALPRPGGRAPRWSPRSTPRSKDGDTLGGVVEVLVYGLPPGLGSHVHWDRRLDSRLAAALMGIQAIKGVEVGDGFDSAAAARLAGARRDRARRRRVRAPASRREPAAPRAA